MSDPVWTLPLVEPFPWAVHGPGGSAEHPDVDVEMPEEMSTEVREAVDKALTVIHGVADAGTIVGWLGETLSKHPHAYEALAGSSEMVGLLAFTVGVPIIMYDVFTTGLRVNEQKGFCYGVMWSSLGGDYEPKSQDYLNRITDEGERKAFQEGVEKGRDVVRDHPELRDAVKMSVVFEATRQGYDTLSSPQERTLGRVWEMVHDKDSVWRGTAAGVRDTYLSWDTPGEMHINKAEHEANDHLTPGLQKP